MNTFDWIKEVDESSLTETERLGLAACRLNCYQWDDYIGEKPEAFDEMTIKEKYRVIIPEVELIKGKIGEAWCSWCWWRFGMGETYDAWKRWWVSNKVEVLENHEGEREKREDSGHDGKDGTDKAILRLSIACILNALSIIFLALKL